MMGVERVKVKVDPLNYPKIVDGKPRARLWFLVLAAEKKGIDTGNVGPEEAVELERYIESEDATDADRKQFDEIYAMLRKALDSDE